jgi:hypothetical protein
MLETNSGDIVNKESSFATAFDIAWRAIMQPLYPANTICVISHPISIVNLVAEAYKCYDQESIVFAKTRTGKLGFT